MNRIKYIWCILIVLCCLQACYDDNSKFADQPIIEVNILPKMCIRDRKSTLQDSIGGTRYWLPPFSGVFANSPSFVRSRLTTPRSAVWDLSLIHISGQFLFLAIFLCLLFLISQVISHRLQFSFNSNCQNAYTQYENTCFIPAYIACNMRYPHNQYRYPY